MKRIVLCFDGTWNALADPNKVTNVVKLANYVQFTAKDGTPQITYYNSGVGSGGPIDRFLGGAFGVGLRSNVKRGLAFLALNYEQCSPEKDDEIYIFGFSRGAYTARALAGIVGVAGIPKGIREAGLHWDYYRRISGLKMKRHKARDDPKQLSAIEEQMKQLTDELAKHTRYPGKEVGITCIGVWDTVGAYGIPAGFGLGGISRAFTYWTRGFRDTEFGEKVQLGLHALAIDETRRPFTPTFWTLGRPRKGEPPRTIDADRLDQVWFAGVHSNVGGGYDDCGLSDLALAWMMARVQEKTGLEFHTRSIKEDVWPCVAGTIYHSDKGWLLRRPRSVLPVRPASLMTQIADWLKKKLHPKRYRGPRINEMVHWSVLKRRQCPCALVEGEDLKPYAPRNLAAEIGNVTEPIGLERELLAEDRDWAKKCPLKDKHACVCRELVRGVSTAA